MMFGAARLAAIVPVMIVLLALSSCRVLYVSDDDADDERFTLDFVSAQDWQAGFADYPVQAVLDYDLRIGFTRLPASLGTSGRGLMLGANNHNADVFMFAARRLGGLRRDHPYRATFQLRFASNLPRACAGRTGELVFVKAGASRERPRASDIGSSLFTMNVDKGNQAFAGADAVLLGNADSGRPCPSNDYVLRDLRSSNSLRLFSDDNGEVWVFVGFDVGFQGQVALYLSELRVELEAL